MVGDEVASVDGVGGVELPGEVDADGKVQSIAVETTEGTAAPAEVVEQEVVDENIPGS